METANNQSPQLLLAYADDIDLVEDSVLTVITWIDRE